MMLSVLWYSLGFSAVVAALLAYGSPALYQVAHSSIHCLNGLDAPALICHIRRPDSNPMAKTFSGGSQLAARIRGLVVGIMGEGALASHAGNQRGYHHCGRQFRNLTAGL